MNRYVAVATSWMLLGVIQNVQADVRVSFQSMAINDCKEIGACDWRLACALGNQVEAQFFTMTEADTGGSIPINRTLTQKEFPPVTVNCKVWEHDGGSGALWEDVGSGSIEVRTTGPHAITLANNEGDVTIRFTAEAIGATGQPLVVSEPASSFESVNYPGYFIRHRFSLGDLTPVVSDLDRADASFVLRAGLSGTPDSVSFESVNFPGHFMRHENYRLKLARNDGSDLFRKDASFVRHDASGRTSFESVNVPDHYIRHRNYQMWIARRDGSALFSSDSSFVAVGGLVGR